MPSYAWLETALVDPSDVAPRMRALRRVGVPYTDAEIAGSAAAVKDKTEQDALIAYLQILGRALTDQLAAKAAETAPPTPAP